MDRFQGGTGELEPGARVAQTEWCTAGSAGAGARRQRQRRRAGVGQRLALPSRQGSVGGGFGGAARRGDRRGAIQSRGVASTFLIGVARSPPASGQ